MLACGGFLTVPQSGILVTYCLQWGSHERAHVTHRAIFIISLTLGRVDRELGIEQAARFCQTLILRRRCRPPPPARDLLVCVQLEKELNDSLKVIRLE